MCSQLCHLWVWGSSSSCLPTAMPAGLRCQCGRYTRDEYYVLEQRIAALTAERDAALARAEAALVGILREACWAWRLTEWRKHSVTAVGTQPTPQKACREIREIARHALEAIGAEAEQ